MKNDVHGSIDLVYCQTAMNSLHSLGGIAEGIERLLVDICCFDAGNLTLEIHDLCRCLFEGGLQLLLLPQCSSCSYITMSVSLLVWS